MKQLDLLQEEYQKKVLAATSPEDRAYPELTQIPKQWLNSKPKWWDNIKNHSLFIDENGRAAGLVNNWDQCYLNSPEACMSRDPNQDLSKMYQSNITTVEGDIEPVSILAATLGHDNFYTEEEAIAFNQGYINEHGEQLTQSNDVMAHQLLYGQYHPVEEGLAFFGAAFPHISKEMVMRVNASGISGAWVDDPTEGKQTFLGAVFVNRGALPLQINATAKYYTIGRTINNGEKTMSEQETVEQETLIPCSCKDKQVNAAVEDEMIVDETMPDSNIADLQATIDDLTSRIDDIEAALVEFMSQG